MFVLTPIVRKNFAAISTKIYEKPTTTGFRAAGPRDNPTTGTVLHDCVSPGKHISQARSSQRRPGLSPGSCIFLRVSGLFGWDNHSKGPPLKWGFTPIGCPVVLNTTPYQGRPATKYSDSFTAFGSPTAERWDRLLTPNMPSCYDPRRKDSPKSGI